MFKFSTYHSLTYYSSISFLWQAILNHKDISVRKYIREIYMGVIAFIISKILCMLKCYTIAKIII